MFLTLGVTILASTTEIQLVLYSHCTASTSVFSAKAYMYLRITLVFLAVLYMYLIYSSVESEAFYVDLQFIQQTVTTIRVRRIPETDRVLVIILA